MQSRKHRSFRILAFVLAWLVLFSSTGFVLDLHYCQGHLKSFAIWGTAENCHEAAAKEKKDKPSCPFHQKMEAQKEKGCKEEEKGCCQNKTYYVHSSLDKKTPETFTLNKALEIAAITVGQFSQRAIIPASQFYKPAFKYYKPPLPDRDLYIFIQCFRN